MQGLLKKLRKRKPVMYEMFGGWGNRIEWFDYQKRKVHGWKQSRPVVGDLIRMPMQSGSDAVFRFTGVEYCDDPRDMFYGQLEGIGYLSDFKDEYIPESEVRVTFLV